MFEELANEAFQQQSKLRQLLSYSKSFIVECSRASQDESKCQTNIPYSKIKDLVVKAAHSLDQDGTWCFCSKQALLIHFFLSRMDRLAKSHKFYDKGLYYNGPKAFVGPWGRGCSLLLDAFYASRDFVSMCVHLYSPLGNRDHFVYFLQQHWQEFLPLHNEFPLNDDERLASQLSSFHHAIKDKHVYSFDSRARVLHPRGRERKGLGNPRTSVVAKFRALDRPNWPLYSVSKTS